MVNDLESKAMRDIGQGTDQLDKLVRLMLTTSADTITVEETKKIIDRCVAGYLRAQNILQASPMVGMPSRRPSNSNGPRPNQPSQAPGRAAGPGTGQPTPFRQHSFPFRSPPPLNGPFGQASQPPNAPQINRPPLNTIPSAGSRAVSGESNGTGVTPTPQTAQQNGAHPGLESHRSPQRAGPGPLKMPTRSASMGMQNTGTPSPQIMYTPREENDSFFEDPSQDYVAAKAIFKPLEDYIIRTFGAYDNLNCAFLIGRPRLRAASSNISNLPAVPTRPAATILPPTTLVETAISEVDAKTLLLGNIGENALWWTGEEENLEASKTRATPVPSKASDLVNIKSPRINWDDVNAWYRLVLLAGLDWEAQLSDATSINPNARSATSEAFAQAREHVHRTVLKVSEGLLRRPGRPLRTPADARFLLILLANPLLYPTIVSPLSAQIAEVTNAPPMVNQDNSTTQPPNKRRVAGVWEQGNAFGNVKRLLGLLSNLSNDCHRHLLAWITRYNETQFKELVGLIQAFMNHRLERQHSRKRSNSHNTPTSASMIPGLGDTNAATSAVLHSALGLKPQVKPADKDAGFPAYSIDWQIKAAARIMSLLFSANQTYNGERTSQLDEQDLDPNAISRRNIKHHGQLMSISDFYNSSADRSDMVADFDMWESARDRFAFCQYPFFLSIASKIRIMEYDAKRQMDLKEREAFFDSILRNRVTERHCTLKVRRDCLADDSLRGISEVVGQGADEIKKGLRIQFVGEEGVDAGGLRKEWFLLLVREIFDTRYGKFPETKAS
jgi:E3 ubiquitin-protein ligase HECTD2